MKLTVTKTIDNPYFSPDHRESRDNPRTIEAEINIRESSIATMLARKHIDEVQALAGNRYRSIYEAAGQSGTRALDWTVERVDGGRVTDGLTARRMDALTEYGRLQRVVGQLGGSVLDRVCGERMSLSEVVVLTRGADLSRSQRQEEAEFLGKLLRRNLDILADWWGYRKADS